MKINWKLSELRRDMLWPMAKRLLLVTLYALKLDT